MNKDVIDLRLWPLPEPELYEVDCRQSRLLHRHDLWHGVLLRRCTLPSIGDLLRGIIKDEDAANAFGLEAAQRLARRIGLPQGQALVLGLFDGGFRAGELFNLRLGDLRFAPDRPPD
jgi:hypothetical protein